MTDELQTQVTREPKTLPPPDPELLFNPQNDGTYVHFQNAADNPFGPDASDLSPVNAWWLAEASLLAYWNPSGTAANPGAAERFRNGTGLTSYKFLQGPAPAAGPAGVLTWTDTQCQVAGNERFVIVAFRGSQSAGWRDAATDAVFTKVPWRFGASPGMVHDGFLQGLEVVWADLLTAVRAARQAAPAGAAPPTVWLTGHSLGAALATLAADRLAQEGIAVQGIYTFGSPRVGDENFCRSFMSRFAGRCFRYVNGIDIVTRIPPPGLLLDYDHVGTEIHFGLDGQISSPAAAPVPAAVAAPPAPPTTAFRLPTGPTLLALNHGHIQAAIARIQQVGSQAVTHTSLPSDVGLLVDKLQQWRTTNSLPPDFVDHTPRRYAVLTWNAIA